MSNPNPEAEMAYYIEDILLSCRPEKLEHTVLYPKFTDRYTKTQEYHSRDKKAIAYIAFGDGYNQAIDDYEKNIKARLQ